jgi:hypothetical protein
MIDLLIQARKASRDPEECRETLSALEIMKFNDDAFRLLHQMRDSRAGFYRYCGKIGEFREDGNNHRVHQRLKYVLLSCPGGALPVGKSFRALAEEAYRWIPPIG